MPKIFISYGRDQSHGQNLATEAQQQLQSAGFEVFRDVIGLKPGDVWYSKLEFELDSSDLVILIVSEKIRTSEWVHNEISMAKEIGLPIIPVIAEQVRMPLWLRHLQALNFSGGEDWQQLLGAIHGHLQSRVSDSLLSGKTSSIKSIESHQKRELGCVSGITKFSNILSNMYDKNGVCKDPHYYSDLMNVMEVLDGELEGVNKRVFISYHNFDDNQAQVYRIAKQLIDRGIDVRMDIFYKASFNIDWLDWINDCLNHSDKIIVYLPYYNQSEEAEDEYGKAIRYEREFVKHELYKIKNRLIFILPEEFELGDEKHLPPFMAARNINIVRDMKKRLREIEAYIKKA